jgi:chromosome segregation protein
VRADEAERRRELHALDIELERLRLEETELARQLSQAESQVALLGEREEAARRQAAALAEEIAELSARGEELKARREAAEAEQFALGASIKERQTAQNAVQERAAAMGRELAEAGRLLEAKRAHLVELARRQASARNQGEQLEGRQRSVAAAAARLETERAELVAEKARLNAHLAETQEALQALDASQAQARQDLSALHEASTRKAAELNSAVSDRDRVTAELTTARARHGALAELAEKFQGYGEGARAVLTASKEGRLPAGFRPLLEALRVPPGLEAAVEAALGAEAQAVIAPSPEAARQAVELLRRQAAGRATILFAGVPAFNRDGQDGQDRSAGLSSGALCDHPGPVPRRFPVPEGQRLLDLVEVDSHALAAARALLDRAVLVDDLTTAFQVVLEPGVPSEHPVHPVHPCLYLSAVTRDGDRVTVSGMVTGGREGKGSSGSQALLARRRERDELKTAIVRLETEAAEKAEGVEALQREAADLSERRSALQGELARMEHRAEAVRREHQRSAADLERRDRTDARLAEAEAANAREQEEVAAALERARAEAETSEFDNAALEREIEAARRALDERQAALRALERETADARVEVAGLEEKARSAGANVRRLAESAGSVDRQARSKREQVAALAAEREALARQRGEQVGEAGRLSERLAALRETAETRRGERAAQSDQLEAAAAHVRELSDRSGELLQRAHRAEVERTASETERTHLIAQLFSDYEIAPEELPAASHTLNEVSDAAAEIGRLRRQVKALGPVNPEAIEEYDRLSERYTFLTGQRDDLEVAQAQIGEAIREIDATTRETFMRAFKEISLAFDEMFQRLFGGGRTELVMTDPSDVLETGIEIIVQPPGKKLQNLLLLSGGERALTASAMLFALLKVRPSPFCVLDEVDAPLDEANVGRFSEVLREFAERSQFIVVTHNRGTMEAADTLYGVTMEEPGISRLVSVRLADVAEEPAVKQGPDLHFLASR